MGSQVNPCVLWCPKSNCRIWISIGYIKPDPFLFFVLLREILDQTPYWQILRVKGVWEQKSTIGTTLVFTNYSQLKVPVEKSLKSFRHFGKDWRAFSSLFSIWTQRLLIWIVLHRLYFQRSRVLLSHVRDVCSNRGGIKCFLIIFQKTDTS